MGTRVATFPGCAVITHWLSHTVVQIFFCLLLVHKTIWCSLSSSSIQTGVLAVTFHITLIDIKICGEHLLLTEISKLGPQ